MPTRYRRAPLRRVAALALMLLGVSVTWAACAGERHRTSFGFSLEIPEGWLVVSAKEIRDNPQLFSQIADKVPSAGDKLVAHVRRKIENGNLELYFDRDAEGFADNINVSANVGAAPKNEQQRRQACKRIRRMYQQRFDPGRDVHECSAAEVGGRNAVYVEAESPANNAYLMQYIFAKSDSILVTLTSTFLNKRLDEQRPAFERIVDSVRFD